MADRSALTSVRTKLFYGLGSVAFGVKDNGFQTILLPFYNLVLHVPAQLVGLAIFIALLVDAFLDAVHGLLGSRAGPDLRRLRVRGEQLLRLLGQWDVPGRRGR